jgi:hypothetical protein
MDRRGERDTALPSLSCRRTVLESGMRVLRLHNGADVQLPSQTMSLVPDLGCTTAVATTSERDASAPLVQRSVSLL